MLGQCMDTRLDNIARVRLSEPESICFAMVREHGLGIGVGERVFIIAHLFSCEAFLMAAALEQLREHKRKVKEEEASVSRALKQARQRNAGKAAAEDRAWKLVGALLNIVLIIYTLADCEAVPAITFLQKRRLQFHWPARSDDDVRVIVEEAYLAADVDELVALTYASAPSDIGAFRIAVRIVEGWRIAQWTQEQNLRGDAPSTRLVLGRFAMRRLAFPPAVRPETMGHAGESAARKRVARWRRLWGGRIATVPVREEIPVMELRSKALVRSTFRGGQCHV